MLGTIVVVILILMLVGALPTWSHSASWGYAPSGMLGTILIVLLILVLLGKLWRCYILLGDCHNRLFIATLLMTTRTLARSIADWFQR